MDTAPATATEAPAPAATESAAPAEAAPSSLLSGAKAPEAPAESKPAEAAPPAEAKPAEGEAKPETPAEVVYEFQAPEGVELDTALVDRWKATAKDAGLSAEQFSKMAPAAAEIVQQLRGEAIKAATEMHNGWLAEIAKDSSIAGQAPGTLNPEASAAAARALDAFGGDALRQALGLTGAGNHPAIVKAFVEIGKALAEDKIVQGRGTSDAPADFLTGFARNTYTSMR